MNKYNCELVELVHVYDGYNARVKLLENHKDAGAFNGDICRTSKVKSIDFERGIIITQNSIYVFKP